MVYIQFFFKKTKHIPDRWQQLKQTEVKGECALYKIESELRESHIYPRFDEMMATPLS